MASPATIRVAVFKVALDQKVGRNNTEAIINRIELGEALRSSADGIVAALGIIADVAGDPKSPICERARNVLCMFTDPFPPLPFPVNP